MPYRAMIYTLGTLMFAAGLLLMWLYAIVPMVNRSDKAESQPAGVVTTAPNELVHDQSGILGHPNAALHKVVRGVMWLTITLLSLLVLVGVFASFREWVLLKTQPRKKRVRTKYVDAWKLAAERMNPPPAASEPPPSPEK